MSFVCGIDLGSLRTPSYVAWFEVGERRFYLDQYIASLERPLPEPLSSFREVTCLGIDAPQGLPVPGRKVRRADELAGVPTHKLPHDRQELFHSRLYRGLIEAGIEIFWSVYSREIAEIPGLIGNFSSGLTVFETYPRYVIKRLWPEVKIPAKNKDPLSYSASVYKLIREYGGECPGVLCPTPDQVDAMLCALAALSLHTLGKLPPGTVGLAPFADESARVLREGFIIAP